MRGGSRPGAGRPKGAANRKTREIADKAAASGLTPLEYLLGLLRNEDTPPDVRFEAAKAAAPYVHARLSSVEQKSEVTHKNVVAMPPTAQSTEEWIKQFGNKGVH